MSMTYLISQGSIPATKLMAALLQGKIKGSRYVTDPRKNILMIKYDKTGLWEGHIKKGCVIKFKEYAGGHGSYSAMWKLLTQLEDTFHCEIIDEIMAKDKIWL